MATQKISPLFDEVAALLASCPTREQLVSFHPSASAQERAAELLQKNNAGTLSKDDHHELDEIEFLEMLMRLVKARARRKPPRRE